MTVFVTKSLSFTLIVNSRFLFDLVFFEKILSF